jgi:hypothetical protein
MGKLKNFLRGIGTWLRGFIANVFDEAEGLAEPAVIITNEIKDFVEEHGDDLERLVLLTEGTKDDKALAFIRAQLPEVARVVVEGAGLLNSDDTDEVILLQFVSLIKKTEYESRGKTYALIASALIQVAYRVLTGKKLPDWLSFVLSQTAFGRMFKS